MNNGQFEPNNEPINFGNVAPQKDEGHSLAIASLVCGLLSIFCCGIPAGIAAIICGFIAKNKGNRSGMMIAGIVLGIVGVVFTIVSMLIMPGITEYLESILAQYQYQ